MILGNSVLLSVILVFALCVFHVNVVISLTAGALFCGLVDGLTLHNTINIFSNGLGAGAKIALSYAILGAFASAVAHSGLPDLLAEWLIKKIQSSSNSNVGFTKYMFFLSIGLMAIACKNVIPVHIAFIPILIPPLLKVFNFMKIDRRAFACIITCGLIVSYMIIPVGFGEIFLDNIMRNYLSINGLEVNLNEVVSALKFPAIAMVCGVFISLFRYRKHRIYQNKPDIAPIDKSIAKSPQAIIASISAILVALVIQLVTREVILSALAGFFVFLCLGIVCRSESEKVVSDGFKMMAGISFTMLAAAGFSGVIHATNGISVLINWLAQCVGDSRILAVVGMLSVGFLISVGIGSCFSTIPIVATVYVPLCLKLGFSPTTTIIIVAVSGICGDAGSPASDSTLGPTMGLNADGQHNHISDTVLPAFMHITVPAFLCGIICALVL